MATYLSDRELRKIERDRRKEEAKLRIENEIRKQEKEERHKRKQELKEREQHELQKQRERLLNERRKLKERSQLMIEMEKNKKDRERIEKDMRQMSKERTKVYDSELSESEEEYINHSETDSVEFDSATEEERFNRSYLEKKKRNEGYVRIKGDHKDLNRSDSEDKLKTNAYNSDGDLADKKEAIDKERSIAHSLSEERNKTDKSYAKLQHTETNMSDRKEKQIAMEHSREFVTERDIDTDKSESDVSEGIYRTVDETYDRDYFEQPKHNSTHIENDMNDEVKFEDELRWLDEKWQQYKNDNAELRTSIEEIRNTKIVKESTKRDSNIQCKHREEEDRLKEKIKQLQIREKRVNEAIEENRILKQKRAKEVEKLKLRQKEAIRQNEKMRLEGEKLKKLKEEETLLKKRIKEKEASLHENKTNKEEIAKSKERTPQTHKEAKSDTIKGKLHKPNIPSLTETTFEEWRIEVEIILKSGLYEENILRQAIRNSLCGNTRKILLTMTPDATTQQIIDKLEGIYGNIRSGESVLSEFYRSKQGKEENVSEWGLRLESILQRAIEKGHVKEEQREEMLKVRFWRHLHNEDLRNATRICFETAKSFEELRRKVRVEENEMKMAREPEAESEDLISCNQHKGEDERDIVMKTVLERMKRLEEELIRVQEKNREVKESTSRDRDRDIDTGSRRSRWDFIEQDRKMYDRYDRGNYRNRYGDYGYRDRRGYRGGYTERDDRQYGNRGRRDYRGDYSERDDRYRPKRDNEKYDRRYDDRENRRSEERHSRYDRDIERGYRGDRKENRADDRYGYDRERNHNFKDHRHSERNDRYRESENKDYDRNTKEDTSVVDKAETKVKGDTVIQDTRQQQQPKTDTTHKTNIQHKPLNQ